jgi:hypothetical protein
VEKDKVRRKIFYCVLAAAADPVLQLVKPKLLKRVFSAARMQFNVWV